MFPEDIEHDGREQRINRCEKATLWTAGVLIQQVKAFITKLETTITYTR